MRSSLIFRYVIKLAFLPLLLLSVFLYLRGHNNPGGGFIGGLVAGAGFALWAYAHGAADMCRVMRAPPVVWIAIGLTSAYISGFMGAVWGQEFLQSLWLSFEIPFIGHLGTTALFDLGVYFVVVGMVTLIVCELFEDIGEEHGSEEG